MRSTRPTIDSLVTRCQRVAAVQVSGAGKHSFRRLIGNCDYGREIGRVIVLWRNFARSPNVVARMQEPALG
jgi:hypothetical protein